MSLSNAERQARWQAKRAQAWNDLRGELAVLRVTLEAQVKANASLRAEIECLRRQMMGAPPEQPANPHEQGVQDVGVSTVSEFMRRLGQHN